MSSYYYGAAAGNRLRTVAAANYTALVAALSPDWHLPLADASGTTAAAEAGVTGTYVNSPQLGVTSIAQDDTSGKSVDFSGADSTTPHITAASPLTGPDFTISLLFQPDVTTGKKHVLATTLGGAVNGEFSIELAAGGTARAWSVEVGAAQVIVGAAADVGQGDAVLITYQRQTGGSWSQRYFVNGVLKAEDATPRTWAAIPAGTVYIGTWWTGAAFSDPADGLMNHVAGWNRVLSGADILALALAQSVVWAVDIDAGSVAPSTALEIDVRQGGWHGKNALVALAGNGGLGDTTESGPVITYAADGVEGNDDTFTYSFTDANGNDTATLQGLKTITIDVQAVVDQTLVAGDAIVWSGAGGAAGDAARWSGTGGAAGDLANWSIPA